MTIDLSEYERQLTVIALGTFIAGAESSERVFGINRSEEIETVKNLIERLESQEQPT